MLTGDTVSTAINIAMACNLIDSDMENDGRLFVFDRGLSHRPSSTPHHHIARSPLSPPLSVCSLSCCAVVMSDMASGAEIRRGLDEAMKKVEEVNKEQKKGKGKGGQKGQKGSNDPLEEDDGPMFGIALHGDVWKRLQKKERKQGGEQKEGKEGESSSPQNEEETKKKGSKDLFRQTMGKRKSRAPPPAKDDEGEGEDSKEDKAADDKKEAKGADEAEGDKKSADKKSSDKKSSRSGKKGEAAEKGEDSEASPSPSSSSSPLLDEFFELCELCQSVIACRLEPKEKADIVDQMRERTGKTVSRHRRWAERLSDDSQSRHRRGHSGCGGHLSSVRVGLRSLSVPLPPPPHPRARPPQPPPHQHHDQLHLLQDGLRRVGALHVWRLLAVQWSGVHPGLGLPTA